MKQNGLTIGRPAAPGQFTFGQSFSHSASARRRRRRRVPAPSEAKAPPRRSQISGSSPPAVTRARIMACRDVTCVFACVPAVWDCPWKWRRSKPRAGRGNGTGKGRHAVVQFLLIKIASMRGENATPSRRQRRLSLLR
ncbi:hypothetical protein CCHR01_18393 [Colletotrichum chrysophilum]|uniref:Uncharacterized protein n=1 Tax=Colletotrichum chrysophilum TaxID=1836956 RepID=A0AAD9A0G0_9PEZI|nr:hypothetical protein CCHR01_18393 [Colletotrichum chrysophilum]